MADRAPVERWDVVIVGGGSAGLSCALTLARARRSVLVVDDGMPRNRAAAHSHGILGFDSLAPARLVEDWRAEVEGFGAVIRTDRIAAATRVTEPTGAAGFALETATGASISARQLVIATGVTDELPAVPGVAELWGTDVVICPYCDGWEVRDRRIAILGTGAKSIGQAHLLRQWSPDVVLFLNGVVHPTATDEVEFAARGIRVVDELVTRVDRLDDRLRVETGGLVHEVDVVFTAPRAVANDALLRSLGALPDAAGMAPGGVIVDARGETEVPGLWAVGNVVNPSLKVATALGDGMAVGTHVNESLVRADVAAALA